MADVSVPSIATATPDGDDTVLGVKDGIVKRFSLDNVGAGINFSAVNATTNMVFNTNGTEKMRLDSVGNLGLGVTPSAWTSSGSTKALQIGSAMSLSGFSLGENLQANIWCNAYVSSSGYTVTYTNNGASTAYRQIAGAHYWYNAPSGTVGDTISFTQAMTLDASGNLGVGTSSPSNKLSVYSSNSGNDDDLIGLGFSVFGPMGSIGTTNLDGQNGGLKFSTRTANALTEKMNIDWSGNLIQTVNTTAATLTNNNTLTFSIVDNSTLRISVRGSDGTTRTATVALT